MAENPDINELAFRLVEQATRDDDETEPANDEHDETRPEERLDEPSDQAYRQRRAGS